MKDFTKKILEEGRPLPSFLEKIIASAQSSIIFTGSTITDATFKDAYFCFWKNEYEEYTDFQIAELIEYYEIMTKNITDLNNVLEDILEERIIKKN